MFFLRSSYTPFVLSLSKDDFLARGKVSLFDKLRANGGGAFR
jgi:hypothetical protein